MKWNRDSVLSLVFLLLAAAIALYLGIASCMFALGEPSGECYYVSAPLREKEPGPVAPIPFQGTYSDGSILFSVEVHDGPYPIRFTPLPLGYPYLAVGQWGDENKSVRMWWYPRAGRPDQPVYYGVYQLERGRLSGKYYTIQVGPIWFKHDLKRSNESE